MRFIFSKSLISFASLACILAFNNIANAALPEVGKTYFTKHNFMFEKGNHITTNYSRGELVPVNSEVQVKSIRGNKMVLTFNGQDITIENAAKYTKKSIEEVGDRLLSTTPVNVTGKFAKEIRFGEMRLGMTKDEVIMTRGYPPAHKTISTESDLWTYWSSRFVQLSIVFEDGKLVQGRGLR